MANQIPVNKKKKRTSTLTKAISLAKVALKPSVITGNVSYLFILSHMRSRSSLLSHILGSHQKICGYSELHTPYSNPFDLIKVRVKLYQELNTEIKGKFILDKLLHNRYAVSDRILESTRPKILFLIRQPESTFKSMVKLGEKIRKDWYKDPNEVLNYYTTRLEELKRYGDTMQGEFYFLNSDHLVNESDRVLSEISDWIGLQTPLSKNYAKFEKTGKSGHGDPSPHIQSGSIVSTKSDPNIHIPEPIIQQAMESFNDCKAYLTSRQK